MATNKVITVTTPSVVTNDTLASYNAYSDQDGALGSLSVAEAASGKTFALSDGVVHSVTVKPVGTSSGEYNAPSNSVTVDLSVGGSNIFEALFAGTTVDARATEVSTASVAITQNNALIMTGAGTTNDLAVINSLTWYSNGFDVTTMRALTFDVQKTNTQTLGRFRVGITKDNPASLNQNAVGVNRATTGVNVMKLVTINGSNEFIESAGLDIVTAKKSIKITFDGVNSLNWYYWDGSAWASLGAGYTEPLTGTWYPVISMGDNATTTSVLTVENFRIESQDFATLRP